MEDFAGDSEGKAATVPLCSSAEDEGFSGFSASRLAGVSPLWETSPWSAFSEEPATLPTRFPWKPYVPHPWSCDLQIKTPQLKRQFGRVTCLFEPPG